MASDWIIMRCLRHPTDPSFDHARDPTRCQLVLLDGDRQHVQYRLRMSGGSAVRGRLVQLQSLDLLHGGLESIAPPLKLHEADAQRI